MEVALELIMQEKDLQTSYSGATESHGTKSNAKISSEFSIQVPLKNMLKDFLNVQSKLRDIESSQHFQLNLNIFAKDENEKVLVERWMFNLNQNSAPEVISHIKHSIYQRQNSDLRASSNLD